MGDPYSPRGTGEGSHDWLWRLRPAAMPTCSVALYKHFLLTYPDTGNHLENADTIAHGQRPRFSIRPLTYGAFLVPSARPHALWCLLLAQGLLVAQAVDLALRAGAVPLSAHGFLVLLGPLSLFTSLAQISG